MSPGSVREFISMNTPVTSVLVFKMHFLAAGENIILWFTA